METNEEDIRYLITIGHGLSVGAVFSTRDLAETTAKNLRLKYYEVIPYRVTKKRLERNHRD